MNDPSPITKSRLSLHTSSRQNVIFLQNDNSGEYLQSHSATDLSIILLKCEQKARNNRVQCKNTYGFTKIIP